jgi:hypothetical protein
MCVPSLTLRVAFQIDHYPSTPDSVGYKPISSIACRCKRSVVFKSDESGTDFSLKYDTLNPFATLANSATGSFGFALKPFLLRLYRISRR